MRVDSGCVVVAGVDVTGVLDEIATGEFIDEREADHPRDVIDLLRCQEDNAMDVAAHTVERELGLDPGSLGPHVAETLAGGVN